jgi:NAD(P)-dependent dehydrogenase (short-subunit alcohol dehydrogenase family)
MVQADLSHEEPVQILFSSYFPYPGNAGEGGWGEVEIAVINHGAYLSTDVPLKDMQLEQWERTFSDNLTSSFLVARAYLRGLERGVLAQNKTETGGRESFGARAAIVFVGSTAGKCGEAMHADYAASKSGAHFSPLSSSFILDESYNQRSCTASPATSTTTSP